MFGDISMDAELHMKTSIGHVCLTWTLEALA